MDFDVKRCSRRCSQTDRELAPKEGFYSVLVAEGSEVSRYDYCEEAWQGPPEVSLGWWKSQMPDPNAKKVHWAPNDVMLEYFEGLDGQPDKEDVRYVLTLLLIRRRVIRLEETETDETGHDQMMLYCPRRETNYTISSMDVDKTRAQEIQEELAKLLFADAA